jgi:hypothetical protein
MWLSWHRLRRLLQGFASWRGNVAGRVRARGEALSFPWEEEHQREPGLLPLAEPDAVEVSVAEARARALLIRLLAPVQRDELERRECFTVQVPGRGRFAILPRRTLNVLNLDSGECYCCITATDVPLSDLMLAQKLLLEHDPEQFFAIANCPSEFLFGALTRSNTRAGRRQRGAHSSASAALCANRIRW